MTAAEPLRAALYARISEKVDDTDKVKNQLVELRELAVSSGYVVAAEYEDDDISAYQDKELRPGFLALLAGIREGHYDVVMATEPTRLTRGSAANLEALNLELVRAGAFLHTRAANVQDPATPMVAAMMAINDVLGGLESTIRIERQQARNRADRARGLPPKGTRPIGWEAVRAPLTAEKAQALGWTLSAEEVTQGAVYVPVRPDEAQVIREAYRAVLEDGMSLWEVARRWTAAGVMTDAMAGIMADGTTRKLRKDRARPGEVRAVPPVWQATTVRQVLTRARNAGVLEHRGERQAISRIEPIVTEAEHEALAAELKRRAEAVAPTTGARPSYLLGGVLECVCGERMTASTTYTQRKGKPRYVHAIYRCRNVATDKRQPHSTIARRVADDAVTLRVLRRILEGDLAPDDAPEGRERLAVLGARLDELTRRVEHARGLLLDPDLRAEHAAVKATLKQLHTEREALEAERSRLTAQRADGGGALESLVAAWRDLAEHSDDDGTPTWHEVIWLSIGLGVFEAMPTARRREIVKALYRVKVNRGGRGPSRLVFTPVQ